MTALPSVSPSPWRSPALSQVMPAALTWFVTVLTLTAVAGAVVWNPLLVLIAVPIALGWIGGITFGPPVFLCFLAGTAGLGFAWVEGLVLEVGGRTVNPSGLHWGMTFGIAAVQIALFRSAALPKLFRPYAALVLLSAAALVWAPDRFDGLKQLLLYGLPLLVGWLTYSAVRTRQAIQWLETAWWTGLAFSGGLALVMAVTAPDLGAGVGGVLGSRSFGIYLLPLLALALAGAREQRPGRALLAAAICVLGVLTLSRMVFAVMLALGVIAFLAGRGPQRLFGVLGVAALGYVALNFEPLRERIFLHANTGWGGARLELVGRGMETQLTFGNLNLSGRGLTWVQTWEHAKESPLLGHGTGGATVFLERDLGVGISHPHNDYLRVLHDLGVIGLAIVLYAGAFVLLRLWRLHRAAPGPWSREWTAAALLAWLAYLMMALTDNTMIYATFFTGSVFMLLAIALRAVELEGEAPRDDFSHAPTNVGRAPDRPAELPRADAG